MSLYFCKPPAINALSTYPPIFTHLHVELRGRKAKAQQTNRLATPRTALFFQGKKKSWPRLDSNAGKPQTTVIWHTLCTFHTYAGGVWDGPYYSWVLEICPTAYGVWVFVGIILSFFISHENQLLLHFRAMMIMVQKLTYVGFSIHDGKWLY